MYILNSQAINKINQHFNLPAKGDEQDWELEISDKNRISEFQRAYLNLDFEMEEKRALFALILASVEDRLSDNQELGKDLPLFLSIINSDQEVLSDIILHWVQFELQHPDAPLKLTDFLAKAKSLSNT